MNIIETLRKSSVEDRVRIITALYEKNRAFFRKKYSVIDKFIESTHCPYQLTLTENFLSIVHEKSGEIAHPEDLEDFLEKLGKKEHGAWRNFVNFQPVNIKQSPVHNGIAKYFADYFTENTPEVSERMKAEKVLLGKYENDLKVLPPTVFVGIFYAMHIDKLLDSHLISKILLVEPDPEKFEVSCYFLDYEKIYLQYGKLPLSIGPVLDQAMLEEFHSTVTISTCLWFRGLWAYNHPAVEPIMQQLRLQQNVLEGITTSFDREIEAYRNGSENIQAGLPILCKKPNALLRDAVIVITASGPSLKNGYEWLKKHRENIIIFAVHSSVLPLKKAGIEPDFQVSMESQLVDSLYLDHTIPFLSNYKVQPDKIKIFDVPLLLIEENLPNVADFTYYLDGTGPSTTTLGSAFAFDCQPKEVYLLGVDVGFRNPDEKFVSGGIHEKSNRIKSAFGELFQVEPNFTDNNICYTNEFFYKVKLEIERQIKNVSGTAVYNLSDGAKIHGAEPKRFDECSPDQGMISRAIVVKKIIDRFGKAEKKKNYFTYPTETAKLIEKFYNTVESILRLDAFDFIAFTRKLDQAITHGVNANRKEPGCLRIVFIERLMVDIFLQWYRLFLLCRNRDEMEKVYRSGMSACAEVKDLILNELRGVN